MVVNEDHYINRIFHEPGDHELTVDEFDTPYVVVAARILVDPATRTTSPRSTRSRTSSPSTPSSAQPFEPPDYDTASLDATRGALLELARGLGGFDHAFGAQGDVDPVRHLLGTAAGLGRPARTRGALPRASTRASRSASTRLHRARRARSTGSGRSRSTTPTATSSRTTATPTASTTSPRRRTTTARSPSTSAAATTIAPNCLPIMDGWNYTVRLYRPRPEILDGSWTFPSIEA